MIEAMLQSALRSAELAEETGLAHDRIILSAKVSGVRDLVDVYRAARGALRLPAPPRPDRGRHGHEGHRGLDRRARRSCSRRASATRSASRSRRSPGGDRTEEVLVAQQVLQSLGLRSFPPQVSACPGCGRTTSTFFQEMARADPGPPARADARLGGDATRASRRCASRSWAASSTARASRKHADIGISLPGTFEEPVAPVFVDGALRTTLRGEGLVDEFIGILEDYVARRYGAPEPVPSDASGRLGSDRRDVAGTMAAPTIARRPGRCMSKAGFVSEHHPPVGGLPRLVQRRGPEGGAGRLLAGARLHDHPAVRLRDLGVDARRARPAHQAHRPRATSTSRCSCPSRCSRRRPSTSRASTHRWRGSPTRAARSSTSGSPSGRPARRSSPRLGQGLDPVVPRPAAAHEPVEQRRPLGAAHAPVPAHRRVPVAGGAHLPRHRGGGRRGGRHRSRGVPRRRPRTGWPSRSSGAARVRARDVPGRGLHATPSRR